MRSSRSARHRPKRSTSPWSSAWGDDRRRRERERERSGGLWPVPHRTWRTKGGSQVTVGGCCLPLPIGCLTSIVGAASLARAAGRRGR